MEVPLADSDLKNYSRAEVGREIVELCGKIFRADKKNFQWLSTVRAHFSEYTLGDWGRLGIARFLSGEHWVWVLSLPSSKRYFSHFLSLPKSGRLEGVALEEDYVVVKLLKGVLLKLLFST